MNSSCVNSRISFSFVEILNPKSKLKSSVLITSFAFKVNSTPEFLIDPMLVVILELPVDIAKGLS